jgi:hypothetical protein
MIILPNQLQRNMNKKEKAAYWWTLLNKSDCLGVYCRSTYIYATSKPLRSFFPSLISLWDQKKKSSRSTKLNLGQSAISLSLGTRQLSALRCSEYPARLLLFSLRVSPSFCLHVELESASTIVVATTEVSVIALLRRFRATSIRCLVHLPLRGLE